MTISFFKISFFFLPTYTTLHISFLSVEFCNFQILLQQNNKAILLGEAFGTNDTFRGEALCELPSVLDRSSSLSSFIARNMLLWFSTWLVFAQFIDGDDFRCTWYDRSCFYVNPPFICMFLWFVDVMENQGIITTALFAHCEGGFTFSRQATICYLYLNYYVKEHCSCDIGCADLLSNRSATVLVHVKNCRLKYIAV